MSQITFLTETTTKHHLYVRIGGRRYKLDTQIEFIERGLRHWANAQVANSQYAGQPVTIDHCFSHWGGHYLQARGVMLIHEIEDVWEATDGSKQTSIHRSSKITSEADVRRCLDELLDIRKKFAQENSKQTVVH